MSNRYSAKLAFYYDDGRARVFSVCEERIISFAALSPKKALTLAKRSGKDSEYEFENSEGNTVAFKFMGIVDIIQLGIECQEEEVWYDVYKKKIANLRSRILSDEHVLSQLHKIAK